MARPAGWARTCLADLRFLHLHAHRHLFNLPENSVPNSFFVSSNPLGRMLLKNPS